MRGKKAPKHNLAPDPKFNNVLIAKFVNQIMRKGKKSTAQNIIYSAFDIIAEKTKKDPLEVFDQAIRNISPVMEVRGRRIGGANYQIPCIVKSNRKQALAFRWISEATHSKKGKPMAEKLAEELIAAAENQGEAVKKKDSIHRMAEANRAFAHFARFS